MKRIFVASLALLALLGAGCGSSLQANSGPAVPTQKTAPPTPPDHIPLPTPVHPQGT